MTPTDPTPLSAEELAEARRLAEAMSTAYKSVGSWDDFDDTVLAFAEATIRELRLLPLIVNEDHFATVLVQLFDTRSDVARMRTRLIVEAYNRG